MGTRDTYQKTIVRACIVAGDETELARRLDVPVGVLVNWLLGHERVPTEMFLRAVDLVLAASRQRVDVVGERVQAVQNFLEQVKRRHAVKRV